MGEKLTDWEDKIKERFKFNGSGEVEISGTGHIYSDYMANEFLDDICLLDEYLFGNTTILIDGDNEANLSDEASKLGMEYNKEYRDLKRSQYRII